MGSRMDSLWWYHSIACTSTPVRFIVIAQGTGAVGGGVANYPAQFEGYMYSSSASNHLSGGIYVRIFNGDSTGFAADPGGRGANAGTGGRGHPLGKRGGMATVHGTGGLRTSCFWESGNRGFSRNSTVTLHHSPPPPPLVFAGTRSNDSNWGAISLISIGNSNHLVFQLIWFMF